MFFYAHFCHFTEMSRGRPAPCECDDNCLIMQEITPYFPGLQVRASSSFVFRNAKWLKGSWKGRNEGTVISVDTAEVRLVWLASGKARCTTFLAFRPFVEFRAHLMLCA